MQKVAGTFDGHFISRQLRYTGVAAVVEIQRSGYPISLRKAEFIKRYRSCAFSDASLTAATLSEDQARAASLRPRPRVPAALATRLPSAPADIDVTDIACGAPL